MNNFLVEICLKCIFSLCKTRKPYLLPLHTPGYIYEFYCLMLAAGYHLPQNKSSAQSEPLEQVYFSRNNHSFWSFENIISLSCGNLCNLVKGEEALVAYTNKNKKIALSLYYYSNNIKHKTIHTTVWLKWVVVMCILNLLR